jgi:hypothetical protein
VPQDFYDSLQPFDYIKSKIEDHKADLGLRYIAVHDDDLIPEFPAVLLQIDNTRREYHATGMFAVMFNLDLWVFHAQMDIGRGSRSIEDITLATNIRKLLHSDRTLGGHIIDSVVDGEFPGVTGRVISNAITAIVTTRLTWMGRNRVPFEMA